MARSGLPIALVVSLIAAGTALLPSATASQCVHLTPTPEVKDDCVGDATALVERTYRKLAPGGGDAAIHLLGMVGPVVENALP